MDPKVKAQWIDALQSGNYKIAFAEASGVDGQSILIPSLRKQDVFSVFGVLCDLHLEAKLGWWREYRTGANRRWRYCSNDNRGSATSSLPDSVAEWAGFPTAVAVTTAHLMFELEKAKNLHQALNVLAKM